MSSLEKAIEIAAAAHAGQQDKEGLPYITHPLRVMARVGPGDAQIVAVLHDVVEDTDTTLDDLRRAGFSEAVLDAVARVTHDKQEPYADYVVRCKPSPLARQVKLADLEDNSQMKRVLLRMDRVESDLARIHRYVLSYKFLTDRITEPEYRRLMAEHG
jgi:(p)ppGpp synthase/HD superfamily hydrolase